jgi:aminoglycoside 6-adenylyltransferase
MRRMRDIERLLDAVAGWGEERDDVHTVVLVGSQARSSDGADDWSDVDLILIVDHPETFLLEREWVSAFGDPLITFVEPTATGGGFERRVLYADGNDVDFSVFSFERARELMRDPDSATVLRRGYRILAGEFGVEHGPDNVTRRLPSQEQFSELCGDFWYHVLWAAKKLRRGEILVAKRSIDCYLKERLIDLLRWHANAANAEIDTWHGERFFERWADSRAVAKLANAYAVYEPRDVERALWETLRLFQWIELETATRCELEVAIDHEAVARLVRQVLETDASG